MNNQMLIESLALGFTLLLIVISVNPMVIGDTTSIKDESPVSFLEEPLGIEFSRTYGGFDDDMGGSARQTKDGGYIFVGTTKSLGPDLAEAGCLIKTDVVGNMEWYRTYGEPGSLNIDIAYHVEQTSDGGYIFTGVSNSYSANNSDVWLVKTDSNGNEEWNNVYGGKDRDHSYKVLQTNDGGYIAGGYTDSYGAGGMDFILVKTNSNGTEEWIRTFGGSERDQLKGIDMTDDGGYILAGYTNSYGVGEVNTWLIKTDVNGNEEWNTTYGNTIYNLVAGDVKQTSDGGYILSGTTYPAKGIAMVLLIKTDANGIMEWNKTFGEPSDYFVGYEVQQTNDGGYIIAGYGDADGPAFSFLIKTDVNGSMEWDMIFEEYDLYNDLYILSVQQTRDGGYILAGDRSTQKYLNSMHDFWVIKVGHVPDIEITKPEKALYLFNTKLIPLVFRARIIGPIDVEVDVSDSEYDIERVEFYIDNKLQGTDISEPYSWKWKKPSIFKHTLKAVAFNSNGNVGIEEIVVSKFF